MASAKVHVPHRGELTVHYSEDRIDWLLAAICEENSFTDPIALIGELSFILNLPPSKRIDVLSECYMSYPNRAY